MPNWLHSVADIIAITIALVSESWRGFLGLVLAVVAWLAIDRHKVYGAFHLGTQMKRLQDERRTLVDQVFPDIYPDLTPTTRAWAEGVIQRSVIHLNLYARRLLILSFYLVSPLLLTNVKLDTVRFLLFKLAGSSMLLRCSACT
jgi:hypothetical protein